MPTSFNCAEVEGVEPPQVSLDRFRVGSATVTAYFHWRKDRESNPDRCYPATFPGWCHTIRRPFQDCGLTPALPLLSLNVFKNDSELLR